MSAQIIDGKAIAAEIGEKTARRAAALKQRNCAPSLAAVRIGEDAAAESYARSQARQAEAAGIDYRLISLPADTTIVTAQSRIEKLNADPTISGIMLHLPLPRTLDTFSLQQSIAPSKDVEGVGATNVGLMAMGREAMIPCTAEAAFTCLKSTGVDLTGREAVVVGRSVIVGKPMALLLLGSHATVTQCHTRTRDLAAHTRRAEILIVAAGVAGLIGAEHVSKGAIVIDVGIHRIVTQAEEGRKKMKTVGDVRFQEVQPIADAITPVPGGVGPVTVAMLLSNTITACERFLRQSSAS